MHAFGWVFSLVFGAMVGSFLNVCIYRLPRDKSLVRPSRSYCPICHEPIAWYDNIPLVSWFLLRGQCRHCASLIAPRYVIVEALTAVLFAVTWLLMRGRGEPLGVIVVYWLITAALIMATFMDLELWMIPDSITLGGTLIAPILSVLVPGLHDAPRFARVYLLWPEDHLLGPLAACLAGIAVGAGLTWVSGVLGRFLFRKEAMGLGDVKFMAALGGLLGWQPIVLVFFLAAILGAVVGVARMLWTKDRHIPFGPFLSGAALIVMHAGDRIFDLVLRISRGSPAG